MCQPRWRESRSRQLWLSPLARRWRSAGQGWHWISASSGLARQAAHAYCSFLHATQCAHTPHTPTNSPPFSGLAHWTDIKVSALGSIVGWTPAGKERTNERPPQKYPFPYVSWPHLIHGSLDHVSQTQTFIPFLSRSGDIYAGKCVSYKPIIRPIGPRRSDIGVMWSVCLSVCWSRSWALQKRLNRWRYRLGASGTWFL